MHAVHAMRPKIAYVFKNCDQRANISKLHVYSIRVSEHWLLCLKLRQFAAVLRAKGHIAIATATYRITLAHAGYGPRDTAKIAPVPNPNLYSLLKNNFAIARRPWQVQSI